MVRQTAGRMVIHPHIATSSGTAKLKSGWMPRYKKEKLMSNGSPIINRGWNRLNGMSVLFVIFSSVILMTDVGRAADLELIDADRLYQNMSARVILDARPISEWQKGHIPGARSFSWENYTRIDEKGIPYRIMPPEKLAAALGKMGISNTTPIVVYGDADKSWGGEGWLCWVLSWLGHNGPVRLLDGGIQAWREKKYSVISGKEIKSKQGVLYEYHLNDTINIPLQEIINNPSAYQLVDTRSTFEWLTGRLPGAVHIKWKNFFTGKNRRPLSPSETKALLEKKGIDPQKPVVYYCTGGVRSAYVWLVHELAGLPAAINYEGGTAEWGKKSP